jgi:hypothetical protein
VSGWSQVESVFGDLTNVIQITIFLMSRAVADEMALSWRPFHRDLGLKIRPS